MLPPKPPLLRRLSSAAHRRAVTSLSPPPPPPLSLAADKCESMEQLKQIHAQMITTAQIHDAFAASRLLNFCALSAAGDLRYAVKLFAAVPARNVFMWNTLIRAHAAGSDPAAGLLLFSEMRRGGGVAAPGKHTFNFLLKASARLNVRCSEQIHSQLLRFGFDCDPHVVNGLIRAYSVHGSIGDARKVFDEMRERDRSVWTTIICGYAQNNAAEEAIKLFYAMIDEGFEPKAMVYASVLSACAQAACLSLGEEIHAYMREKGVEMNVIIVTALIDMYAKNGALAEARRLFDDLEVRERSVGSWNAMITGLAVHGRAHEAIEVFREMEGVGARPNGVTLLGVLSACCHGGMVELGREVFASMEGAYGVEPNVRHYGCLVDLLGRGGRVVEAEAVIRGMPGEADVAMWGALLSACRSWGEIEVAERVAREVQRLDPGAPEAHVALSNMYAEAGRWGDVVRRRRRMREGIEEGSLRRPAGWSAVDGRD